MAITLADFTKIWASTSPLTPYSFTDANYQEGWNFVGSTPPARQMWDGYMKWSDEKQQYIVQNFLPLAGGTMTGALTIGDNTKSRGLLAQNGTSCFRISSGEFTYANAGAFIHLFSNTADTNAGNFQISAHTSSAEKSLVGKSDGTLTWDSKAVVVATKNILAGTTSAVTVPANGTETVNVSFGTTFATAPKVVASCSISHQGTYAGVVSVNTTGCVIRFNNTSTSSRSLTADWIAIAI